MKQDISNTLHDQAHAKSMQIFRYLQALNQLRNPTKRDIQEQAWIMWFHGLPHHPCIRRGTIPSAVDENANVSDNQLLEEQKNEVGASHIHAVSTTVLPPKPEAIVIATQKEYEPVNPVGQHVSSRSVSQHTSSPSNQENKQGTSNFITFLRGKGLTVIDKRASGGAIWVVGGSEVLPMIKELETRGIRFRFAQNGSQSTQNRPAWFTVSKVE